MKTILILIVITIFTTVGFSQHEILGFQIDEDGSYYYEKTITVDSTLTTNEIFYLTRLWINENFNRTKGYHMEYDVMSEHNLVGLGTFFKRIWFDIEIEVNDNNCVCIHNIKLKEKRKCGRLNAEMNENERYFFKKDGTLKKQEGKTFIMMDDRITKLFPSLEKKFIKDVYPQTSYPNVHGLAHP